VLSVYVCTCVIRKKIFTTYTFSVPWAGERDELARWRRPCEMAAAGEACDGRGESARAGASNDVGERGAGGWSGPSIRTYACFVALPLKTVHDEILAQC
jgi:hypothetical protein